MFNFDRMNECATLLAKNDNPSLMTELIGYCNEYVDSILTKWNYAKEDKEDIKQEIALKVFNIFQKGQFNPKNQFSFYFDRVVKNYLSSFYRKFVSMHIPDSPIERLMELPAKDNVEHEVRTKIRVEKIKSKMLKNEKELVTLNLYESGFSMPEIDSELGQKRGTAHFRMTVMARRIKRNSYN